MGSIPSRVLGSGLSGHLLAILSSSHPLAACSFVQLASLAGPCASIFHVRLTHKYLEQEEHDLTDKGKFYYCMFALLTSMAYLTSCLLRSQLVLSDSIRQATKTNFMWTTRAIVLVAGHWSQSEGRVTFVLWSSQFSHTALLKMMQKILWCISLCVKGCELLHIGVYCNTIYIIAV